MLCQYNAGTGEMVSDQPVKDMSPRVPHFDLEQNNHFAGGIGAGVQRNYKIRRQSVMYFGNEEICKIPRDLTWEEQAQVGGTHLFLASAKYGMIILKAATASQRAYRTSGL